MSLCPVLSFEHLTAVTAKRHLKYIDTNRRRWRYSLKLPNIPKYISQELGEPVLIVDL